MGIRSFLGLGPSNSSSSAGSSRTSVSASGMSTTGWHPPYDEATAWRHHREAQVSLDAAKYDADGTRRVSPPSDPQHVNRSFWRS
ncbi:hypothetical protein ABTZ03_30880 [Kitasatospora sp. NPDC096077]|uniref:hypothetical protein n=1 Tax=Kitasatospora sp. NPDC096077 TaxID=3155544 RepID=UPI0033175B42